MKILSLWPWPQGHPRIGDGADKFFKTYIYHHAKYEWNPSKDL